MIDQIPTIFLTLQTNLALLTALSVILFAIGAPIVLVFGIWVLGFHFFVPIFPIKNVAIQHFVELQSFPYTAIPLFIVVGDLIYEANISNKIITFVRSFVGWIPGVTGNTAIATSAVFSAITGSNAATTASVGKALYPNLVDENYNKRYAAGTIAAGGTLGAIIPPSILLIVYGVMFNVPISELFLAGIIPGLAMLLVLLMINSFTCYTKGYGEVEQLEIDPITIVKKAWDAKIGLGTIIVLLGGIFAGLFTPTESATVATFYILITGPLSGDLNDYKQIIQAGFTSLLLIGVIFPVVIMSILIQQNLSFLGFQEVISNWLISLGNPYIIAILMIIILLITGSTLSSVPNIVLTAPLLLQAASTLGFSPVMWGILFMMSDSIGFITPPYGINLYVASGITGIDYIKIAVAAIPYLFGLIAVWLVFFAFPGLNILV
jgi:C4-dicarboxylate transporter DctM subunit